MNRSKIASGLFVGLIVMSVVGGNLAINGQNASPIGNAEAVHDCGYVDAGVYAFAFGGITGVNKDKCANNHVEHAVQEVREAETEQDQIDLFSAALGQEARSTEYNALFGNYLQDTESVAWMKAEAAVARAWNNGSTQSQAKVAAREAIAEYYAVKQINLIQSWNTTTTAADYIRERSASESFAEHDVITWASENASYNIYGTHTIDGRTYMLLGNPGFSVMNGVDVTLVNNSQYMANGLGVETGGSNQDTSVYVPGRFALSYSTAEGHEPGNFYQDMNGIYLMLRPPNSNYEPAIYTNYSIYRQAWNDIETKNTNLQNETDLFVDSIWSDLESGNINTTDVLSRTTTMFEYGVDSSNNRSYYNVIGALSGMGLDTPNLNGTGQMQITDHTDGTTYDGMLFARNAPNGTWEKGVRYDATEIPGPVFVGSVDGQTIPLEGEFTVNSIVDKSGNDQETVQTINYNYKTANTSDLQAKYDQLLQLTQELQDRSESVGGGGSTDEGGIVDWLFSNTFGIPNAVIVFIGLAGLSVVANRGNN